MAAEVRRVVGVGRPGAVPGVGIVWHVEGHPTPLPLSGTRVFSVSTAAGAKGSKAKGGAPAAGDRMSPEMVSRFGAEPEAEMLTMIGVWWLGMVDWIVG